MSETVEPLEPKKSKLRSFLGRISKRTFALLLLSFLCLGSSLILEKLGMLHLMEEPPHSLWIALWSVETPAELLREIAFALGIAFAVIATVELESRAEFNDAIRAGIREIQRNVFSATFERHIPRQIIDEVNRLVFGADFVRHDHTAHYIMTVVDSEDESGKPSKAVSLVMNSEYIIENVGLVATPFIIRLALEKQPFENMNKAISVELNGLELDGETIPQPSPNVTETERRKTFQWTTQPIQPGQKLTVRTNSTVLKSLTDYDIWRSAYPTSTLRLIVTFPVEAALYGADQLHRLPLKSWPVGPRTRQYETQGAVLPHQGVVVWWSCDLNRPGTFPHIGQPSDLGYGSTGIPQRSDPGHS
jgi:hypothetical protein